LDKKIAFVDIQYKTEYNTLQHSFTKQVLNKKIKPPKFEIILNVTLE